MKIVYLKPKSSFGAKLKSDTLWGLICWGIKVIHSEEKLVEFLHEYDNADSKKFVVSSMFEYYGEKAEERKLLFPRPLLEPHNWHAEFSVLSKSKQLEKLRNLKKFKKERFVEWNTLSLILSGVLSEKALFEQTKLWEDIVPQGCSISSVQEVHNTIDRLTASTKDKGGFYQKSMFRAYNAGLFFLMDGTEEQIKIAESSLRFLSDFGFGGDNSIGKNIFDVSIEEFHLPNIPEPNAILNLSLYSPNSIELSEIMDPDNKCFYDLAVRKGKVGGHFLNIPKFWKDTLFAFTEGSTFSLKNKSNYGRIVKMNLNNSSIPFDVLQNGFSLHLPMRMV